MKMVNFNAYKKSKDISNKKVSSDLAGNDLLESWDLSWYECFVAFESKQRGEKAAVYDINVEYDSSKYDTFREETSSNKSYQNLEVKMREIFLPISMIKQIEAVKLQMTEFQTLVELKASMEIENEIILKRKEGIEMILANFVDRYECFMKDQEYRVDELNLELEKVEKKKKKLKKIMKETKRKEKMIMQARKKNMEELKRRREELLSRRTCEKSKITSSGCSEALNKCFGSVLRPSLRKSVIVQKLINNLSNEEEMESLLVESYADDCTSSVTSENSSNISIGSSSTNSAILLKRKVSDVFAVNKALNSLHCERQTTRRNEGYTLSVVSKTCTSSAA